MKVFGNFETLGEVTSTNNIRLFRCRDRVSEREALVHVFSADGLTSTGKQRLLRELAAASKLSHPNIASLLDFGEQDGVVYAAVEASEGETIARFPADAPVESKIQLIHDICDGLAYAHAQGVPHRAIEPAAIVVTSSGKPKILNFGFAAATSAQAKPNYLSPEQLRYQRGDARSDVFSAAVVFFELLTGKPPFFSNDIIEEILRQTAPMVTDVNGRLPSHLDGIIAKALSKEAASRYQNASEFLDDLRERRASARPTPPVIPFLTPVAPIGEAVVIDDEPVTAQRFIAKLPKLPRLPKLPSLPALPSLPKLPSLPRIRIPQIRIPQIHVGKVPLAAAAVILVMIGVFLTFSSTGGSAPIMGTGVIGHDTVLRSRPDNASADIGRALKSQPVEFLKNLPEKQANAWVEVRMKASGATGYVHNTDLDSVETPDAAFNLWHSSLVLDNLAGLDTREISDRIAAVQRMMDRYPRSVTDEIRTKVTHAQSLVAEKPTAAPPVAQPTVEVAPAPKTEVAPDPYDAIYAKARRDFDKATTEAELQGIIKQCEPILKPGLFEQPHGLDLQTKCRQLKDRALKAIEILQRG